MIIIMNLHIAILSLLLSVSCFCLGAQNLHAPKDNAQYYRELQEYEQEKTEFISRKNRVAMIRNRTDVLKKENDMLRKDSVESLNQKLKKVHTLQNDKCRRNYLVFRSDFARVAICAGGGAVLAIFGALIHRIMPGR
jgi:uncharacterized membrane protein